MYFFIYSILVIILECYSYAPMFKFKKIIMSSMRSDQSDFLRKTTP